MRRIFLIACVSKKSPSSAPAAELYQSPLFTKAYAYALSRTPDEVYILSAKYGLIVANEIVEPYNETLNGQPVAKLRSWADNVVDQLKKVADLQSDKFTLLAGLNYRKFIIPHLSDFEIPLEGLGIGKQLQKLDNLINEHRGNL